MVVPHATSSKLLFSLVLATSACATDPADPEPIPLTTVAATDTSLGVRRWEIVGEGDRTIIGRGDAGERLVEAIVTRDPETPDRVRISVVVPEPADFELLTTGEVVGEASPIAQLIARTLFDDLGHHTTPLDQPQLRSSLYLSGTIYLGWSLFGYAAFQDVGQFCPKFMRSEDSGTFPSVTVVSCTLDWLSPSRGDCRARIKFQMPPDRWGNCSWHVDIEGPALP